MAYTVSNYVNVTGQNLYGDLSVEDALTIQSKMLPVAKKAPDFRTFRAERHQGAEPRERHSPSPLQEISPFRSTTWRRCDS